MKVSAQLLRLADALLGWGGNAAHRDDGYQTLLRMEQAPHYNAWVGRLLRGHLGRRVLEVGAGLGTITRELEAGLERLVALEVEPFYVQHLHQLFRDKPHVRPYLADITQEDLEPLLLERLDSVVLSNVLEHLSDDVGALKRLARVLQPQARLVLLVPALPALYGSLDEAVGHHRRYTPRSLRETLEGSGFHVEKLSWMNLVGIPGWFLNSRLLKRRVVPAFQLKLYDQLAPLLARTESRLKVPIGMSLFAVARFAGATR